MNNLELPPDLAFEQDLQQQVNDKIIDLAFQIYSSAVSKHIFTGNYTTDKLRQIAQRSFEAVEAFTQEVTIRE